jgi:hypothetical protein
VKFEEVLQCKGLCGVVAHLGYVAGLGGLVRQKNEATVFCKARHPHLRNGRTSLCYESFNRNENNPGCKTFG